MPLLPPKALFQGPSISAIVLAACVLGLTGIANARAQRAVATVDSTESVVDYTGSAPMHDWTGTSQDVAGRFMLDPEHPDSSRAVIRVPVASFDSGNDLRDRKMRTVTEADQHPIVEFRTTSLQPVQWGRASEGYAGRWAVTGALTFHGRTHTVETTADVRISDGQVRVRAKFPISLTRFNVERPSILWASVADTIRIDARIVGDIEKAPSAARRSGGPQTKENSARSETGPLRDRNEGVLVPPARRAGEERPNGEKAGAVR
ncbi:MAG: YceI family protein [Salinibacter sp.]|uniref:YceI family protein n=1 Tax=Salinibacter sp. TaxID=2065818 RepID=UPI0035D49DA0